MNDALAQLAEANPVRAEDLTPLGLPDRFAPRRVPRRRLGAAVAITAAAVAVVGAFAFHGFSSVSGHGRLGQGNGDIPRLGRIGDRLPLGLIGPTGAAGANGLGVTGSEGPVRPGATGQVGPSGSNRPPDPHGARLTSVGFDRTGADGALKGVGVTVSRLRQTGFQLEVRYLGPPGNFKAPYPVVYRTTVLPRDLSLTTGPVGVGPSGGSTPGAAWTWSGRLDPGDWRGGCQSGDYEIDIDWDAGGAFSIDVSTDYFQCTGS